MQKEFKYVMLLLACTLGYVVVSDQGWIGKASVAEPGAGVGGLVAGKNICLGGETQSLTISGVSIDDRTAAITETTNLYRRTGDTAWTAWTLGTGITALSAGENYEFVVGTGLTDHTDNAWGPSFSIKNMPCRVQFTLPVYNDEDESGTTFTWYDADNNVATETFAANEVQTVSFKVKATAEQYFGNPTLVSLDPQYTSLQSSLKASGVDITFNTPGVAMPNICYLSLNETSFDIPDQMSVGGRKMKKLTGCPKITATAGFENHCYEAPIITGTQQEIFIDINTDDTYAPVTDGTFGCFAASYYVDGDTAELAYGVEDEDTNAVGVDAAETATLDAI